MNDNCLETTKRCRTCGEEKMLGSFNKKKESADGLMHKCKACVSEYNARPDVRAKRKAYRSRPEVRAADRAYRTKYRSDPKNKAIAAANYKRRMLDPTQKAASKLYDRAYISDPQNKIKRADYMKSYMANPEHRARHKANMKVYSKRPEVRARKQERHNYRMANDPTYRTKKQVGSMAYRARRYINNEANLKSSRDFGCTSEELISHMAKTWFDRYGEVYDPNIHEAVWDHIFPLSRVLVWSKEVIAMVHCWSNFQLLTPEMNGEKGNKLLYMEFASDEVKEYIKSNNLT